MEQPTKKSLRNEARKILAGISAEARAAASAEICRRIEGLSEWSGAGTVALYAAQASEPDLGLLLRASGKRFCFPRVQGNGLEFHRCDARELLRAGRWELMEPHPDECLLMPASEIDLFCVPGLAFTRAGGRLGRGGGFYDRFLSGVDVRAVKVGICFHAQVVRELPLETHDHEVGLVVTEEEVIRCG